MPSKANLPMVCCPFNNMHVVGAEYLQTHIIKCQKNYPNHVTCPYNALHKFLSNEQLENHLANCTSKSLINGLMFGNIGKSDAHGDMQERPFYFKVLNSTAWQNEHW